MGKLDQTDFTVARIYIAIMCSLCWCFLQSKWIAESSVVTLHGKKTNRRRQQRSPYAVRLSQPSGGHKRSKAGRKGSDSKNSTFLSGSVKSHHKVPSWSPLWYETLQNGLSVDVLTVKKSFTWTTSTPLCSNPPIPDLTFTPAPQTPRVHRCYQYFDGLMAHG